MKEQTIMEEPVRTSRWIILAVVGVLTIALHLSSCSIIPIVKEPLFTLEFVATPAHSEVAATEVGGWILEPDIYAYRLKPALELPAMRDRFNLRIRASRARGAEASTVQDITIDTVLVSWGERSEPLAFIPRAGGYLSQPRDDSLVKFFYVTGTEPNAWLRIPHTIDEAQLVFQFTTAEARLLVSEGNLWVRQDRAEVLPDAPVQRHIARTTVYRRNIQTNLAKLQGF